MLFRSAQGQDIPDELVIDRVLHSFPPRYHEFVMDFLMQEVPKSLHELFEMLRTTKIEVKEEHAALKVNKAIKRKPRRKGKSASSTSKAPKSGYKPGVECYYCKGEGHWKRNCPKYLADKKVGKIAEKERYIRYTCYRCLSYKCSE